jgi:quinol monooxygenase YgiN
MLVIHVHVRVKAEFIDAFREATIENARNSIKEPGVARFDIFQQEIDATRFLLEEIYLTPEDPARHKETAHYNTWRETVADMLAEERTRTTYSNVFTPSL